ncbi:hypothetical protein AKJ09_01929 [Labilithrix luteola]|uniref:Lipoprotein n=1 Tax=Labilithrix luteola TaxID=1391654 RepID=A0A0K1PP05_9BACT|nr:hypothetical protein [Labilithrix luteola]AKU95265.1 hypothetical protein AKJ09_01929 [Labilithrix luteola]
MVVRSHAARSMFLPIAIALAACNGQVEDDASGELTSATSGEFRTESYGTLEVVADGDDVRGHVFRQVGELGDGGVKCEFTFSGRVERDSNGVAYSSFTAADGWETTSGVVTMTRGGPSDSDRAVTLRLDYAPKSCGRVFAAEFVAGYTFQRARAARDPKILGFAPVKAGLAYFSDTVAGTRNKAYVVQGDIVDVLSPDQSGYVRVRHTAANGISTTGYLVLSDLVLGANDAR